MCNSRKNPSKFQVSFWNGSRKKQRKKMFNFLARKIRRNKRG